MKKTLNEYRKSFERSRSVAAASIILMTASFVLVLIAYFSSEGSDPVTATALFATVVSGISYSVFKSDSDTARIVAAQLYGEDVGAPKKSN